MVKPEIAWILVWLFVVLYVTRARHPLHPGVEEISKNATYGWTATGHGDVSRPHERIWVRHPLNGRATAFVVISVVQCGHSNEPRWVAVEEKPYLRVHRRVDAW